MAKKTAKSGLAAKLGAKGAKAVQAHRNDPVNYGQIDLPGGIKNGIAKLTDCKFDQYKTGKNQGEYYFRAVGTVISPASVTSTDGTEIPVAGLQTSFMEAACDTTKANGETVSVDIHLANILNEMQKLGLDTSDAEIGELEELAAVLKESGPYFRFSTSQSAPSKAYPDPRVWENWHGSNGLEDYEPEDEDDVDEDDSEVEEEEIEEDETEDEVEETEEEETEEEESEEDELSWKEKGAATDDESSDDDYEDELGSAALEAGISQDDIDNADDWESVGVMIDASDEGGDGEEFKPVKGEKYSYKPPKSKKAITVTITAVFDGKETCNAKSGKNTYKSVPWDKLSEM